MRAIKTRRYLSADHFNKEKRVSVASAVEVYRYQKSDPDENEACQVKLIRHCLPVLIPFVAVKTVNRLHIFFAQLKIEDIIVLSYMVRIR